MERLAPIDPTAPITPDFRLPIRAIRPPMRLKDRRLARLCVRFFYHQVSRRLAQREEHANAHISKLLQQIQFCRSRAEFEAVLGRPIYIVSGKGFGTIGLDGKLFNVPDLIETYDCGNCCIDLTFKDAKVQERIGYIKLTALYVEFSKQKDER
jgi:hypothetical protein